MSRLMDLPTEILLTIADFLDTGDVASFLQTARQFANLLNYLLYQRARTHIIGTHIIFEWYWDRIQDSVTRDVLENTSVLDWAAERGHTPVMRKVLRESRGAPISAVAKTKALCLAARAGMHCTFEPLVTGAADLSSAFRLGEILTPAPTTPLQLAIKNGHEKATHLLLEMGADISATDSMGRTALHYAAKGGHETITRLLLELGADIAAVTSTGDTALHCAVSSDDEAVVRLLLEKGIDVGAIDLEATTTNGETALHYATYPGKEPILDLLLRKGANVNAYDDDWGFTPLLFVLQHYLDKPYEITESQVSQCLVAVRLLFENGADVMGTADGQEGTALHMEWD